MNVIQQYPDILQNIEFAVTTTYRELPELRDPEVIAAMEKLVGYYTRQKKKLPQLPVVLSERSMAVFLAMKSVCEFRREDGEEPGDQPDLGGRVPLRIIILCLERVLESALTWHKRSGQRGYLNYIDQFIV